MVLGVYHPHMGAGLALSSQLVAMVLLRRLVPNILGPISRLGVRQFFEKGSELMRLHRPRYGLDCTIGKRLAEDFVLMSYLADKCGLQQDVNNIHYPSFLSTRTLGLLGDGDIADLTLTLMALISQTTPWTVCVHEGSLLCSTYRATFVRYPNRSVLELHTSTTFVKIFVPAIQLTGILISQETSRGYDSYGRRQHIKKCSPKRSSSMV